MNPFKLWLLRFGLAASTACLLAPAVAAEPNQLAMNLVYQRTLPSIVSITVQDHNDQLRRGSGFFVSDNGLFITAFSVVENARRITVRSENGWLHTVDEVIALSKEHDLALLRAPVNKTRALELIPADTVVQPGETAIAVAGAQGLQWHISDGKIVAPPDNTESGNERLYFSNPVKPGNQGGPLVNRYGRVVGVLQAAGDDSEEGSHQRATPTAHVHALLDKINVLPLSATWTEQPLPPPRPPQKIVTAKSDLEDEALDAEEETPEETPEQTPPEITPESEADAETDEPATAAPEQAVEPEPAAPAEAASTPEPIAVSERPEAAGKVAQHLGQIETIAWAAVPSQPEPGRVCPPMISLELEREFRWRAMGDRSYADGHLSLGGRLDTGKECNMWGCFDGYRLFMHFMISNSQGETLYRKYFEVDEDDVDEACEELAEDIVDELEDLLD